MMFPRLLCLLACAPGLAAASEIKPDQKAIVEALTAGAVQSKVVTDADGNVTKLAISNHEAFWDKAKGAPPKPMTSEVFAQVVGLPKLQAIALEKQMLTDADYALLGQLKDLRDVRLHYLAGPKSGGTATRNAPLFINELPARLEVLEIKHNFSIDGGCMDQLKAQPDLVKLEIDTGYCTNAAVPFIKGSPKIRNLQLHRTTITDDQFQELIAALPQLEMLEVRPNGPKDNPITGRSLRALRNSRNLKLLALSLNWKELPFEGGLDALVGLPNLRYLSLAPNDLKGLTLEDPAIQKLHQARPDILIRVGGKTLGGTPDDKPPQIDAEWNWDGGVTTHG